MFSLQTSRDQLSGYWEGVNLREHVLTVPRDHFNPDSSDLIEVYTRELFTGNSSSSKDKPYLLYLQGGPGFPSPRPADISGWLKVALKHYRVLLLDQRGTGRSTPVDGVTISQMSLPEQIRTLSLLRADQIVADAEALRHALHPADSKPPRWSVLGQSFGGFCITAYLSRTETASGLQECFITGGLPALDIHVDDNYRATYAQTAVRNKELYARLPQVEKTIREVSAHLEAEDERLPTGERLSARRFRTIGIDLGRSTGPVSLTWLLESPWHTVRGNKRLRTGFLEALGQRLSYASHPLYAAIHETIYAGASAAISGRATNWSAQRIREEIPGFAEDADPRNTSEPFFLTGEHIFPWQFEEDPALRPFQEVAEVLATKMDWPTVYNPQVIAEQNVHGAAAVYTPDMFVPTAYSRQTGALMSGVHVWELSDRHHNALGVEGEFIFSGLRERLGQPA